MKYFNLFFLLTIALLILLLSCEKNELNTALKKADIVFDKIYDDINSVPQRIVRNSNDEFFLYGWEYIIKVDENGNKLWAIKQNNKDLCPTKDGGCIIAYSNYLTKINSEGNIEWEKSGANYELSKVIIGDNDEIYGVGDFKISYNYVRKPKFYKYTKDGDYLSSRLLINANDNINYQTMCMTKLKNNRLVIGTFNNISNERENCDYNIIEFAIDEGSTIIERHYGGYKNDYIRNIFETQDGGLILVGYSESKDGDVKSYRDELSLDGANGWIVKLDANREITWEKMLGGTGSTFFYKTIYLNNNYLVGFETEATDVDFKGVERPKSGFIIFDEVGNILDLKYIGAWSVDCEFNSKGELLLLSSNGDDYYNIYKPRLVKIK